MNIAKMYLNVNIKDINPHLLCVLCGGYYIDATTIVECLHSFCRSCIVKHLESSKYCPICEVMVHKTKPLANIRRDKTLQNLVYKLVPGLYERERHQRRQFYIDRPHYVKPDDLELAGDESYVCRPQDKNITVSLRYHNSDMQYENLHSPRYFRCPVGVRIKHLQKLLLAKHGLIDGQIQVQIFFKDQILPEEITLLDVSCLYFCDQRDEFDLTFLICEKTLLKSASEPMDVCEKTEPCVKTEVIEKEVQLQITESGVMSVSEVDIRQIIDCTELDPGPIKSSAEPTTTASSSDLDSKMMIDTIEPSILIDSSAPKKQLPCTTSTQSVDSSKESNRTDTESENKGDTKCLSIKLQRYSLDRDKTISSRKRPSLHEDISATIKKSLMIDDKEKNLIIPHIGSSEIVLTMSGASLDSNHSEVCNKPKTSNDPVPPKTQNSGKVSDSPKPRSVVVDKQETNVGQNGEPKVELPTVGKSVGPWPVPKIEAVKPIPSSTESKGIRPEKSPVKMVHKSIRSTPQMWHPTITKEKLRPTLMKNSDEPRKPNNKFFKARQMPRFLGNPASGVKPMYSNGLPPASPPPPTRKLDQIARVDPKTLRPIQKDEKKTPNTLLTNPFIPRDNHFLLPDPKTQPYSTLNLPPGFHSSLPPSISLLLNPHQHFRNLKAKEEAAKLCDKVPEIPVSASSSTVVIPSAEPSKKEEPTHSEKSS